MAKRKLLNVRSVLEHNIWLNDTLMPILLRVEGNSIPPILIDALREQAFLCRAILRKHEHTAKDVRFT